MWETDLPVERLQLHRVYRERNWNTNRSTDLTVRRTALYSEKNVHMSHVLFQPITNTAHSCTQCVTIVTQYTDTSTIALVRDKFTEDLHVMGTVPVSPDTCKSRQHNYVQKGKSSVKKPPAVKETFILLSCRDRNRSSFSVSLPNSARNSTFQLEFVPYYILHLLFDMITLLVTE